MSLSEEEKKKLLEEKLDALFDSYMAGVKKGRFFDLLFPGRVWKSWVLNRLAQEEVILDKMWEFSGKTHELVSLLKERLYKHIESGE